MGLWFFSAVVSWVVMESIWDAGVSSAARRLQRLQGLGVSHGSVGVDLPLTVEVKLESL